jgi:hypothetical protein
MFINGQKVVCIDDTFEPMVAYFYTALPVKDKVYVVRGMAPAITINHQEDICVYLVGLQNPNSSKAPHRERGFRCERFRPLDELTEEEILKLTKVVGESIHVLK